MASATIFFIAGTLVCVVSAVIALYNIGKSEEFSFLNQYPYELFRIQKKENRIPWFFFCLGLVVLSCIGLCLALKDDGLVFQIGNVALMLPFLAFGFLTYLTLYREKWHLSAFLIYALLSMFVAISFSFYLLTDTFAVRRSFSQAAGIVLLIFGIVELLLLVNPLLYRYAKMKKEVVDDEERIVRPKVIWLAFTEWLYFLLDLFAVIFIVLAVG